MHAHAPRFAAAGLAAAILAPAALAGGARQITVEIENLAPQFGTWQTPFWVGFHNGEFDYFNLGDPASNALERLAEDGNVDPLNTMFMDSGFGGASGLVGGGPIAPGDVVSMTFDVDAADRFFSFASMVIPSNDAFVGNDDPNAIEIFDASGNFTGADFFITGSMVLDAGTEVNTEMPEDTAFFGQMNPDTGPNENGVVHEHPGYLGSFGNPGEARILDDPMFGGADFTLPGYPIARIRVIPTPGAVALLGLGLVAGTRRRR